MSNLNSTGDPQHSPAAFHIALQCKYTQPCSEMITWWSVSASLWHLTWTWLPSGLWLPFWPIAGFNTLIHARLGQFKYRIHEKPIVREAYPSRHFQNTARQMSTTMCSYIAGLCAKLPSRVVSLVSMQPFVTLMLTLWSTDSFSLG